MESLARIVRINMIPKLGSMLTLAQWYISRDSAKAILAATPGPVQDVLTAEWRNAKATELQYVGLTVSSPTS